MEEAPTLEDNVPIEEGRTESTAETIDDLRGGSAGQVSDVTAVSEQIEFDPRLKALIVDPINDLPEDQRTIDGSVRTGEEIAAAIPGVAAFLVEVNFRAEWKAGSIFLEFFELNEEGQLVMMDDCAEPYGLEMTPLQAQAFQTRIIYRDAAGETQVLSQEECFKQDDRGRLILSGTYELIPSDAAQSIDPDSILMVRGLARLIYDVGYSGEYARMNKGQLDRMRSVWVDMQGGRPTYAEWYGSLSEVRARRTNYAHQSPNIGSRGVLRVNLNFGS